MVGEANLEHWGLTLIVAMLVLALLTLLVLRIRRNFRASKK